MKLLLTIFISASCVYAAPQKDSSPEAQVSLFGRVRSSDTHEPVRRAIIKIYDAKDQWDVFTDGDGHFRFPGIVTGEYTLIAHRDGFIERAYKVERSDFESPKELQILLFRQGVIEGKIADGFGQPLPGVQVEARRSGSPNESAESAETNDLGEYRLSGLNPGTYQIRATYRNGGRSELDSTPVTAASSYYGGTAESRLPVKPGSIIPGIDFMLNPVRPVTIRGTVHRESGSSVEKATVCIMSQDGPGSHDAYAEKGEFAIQDVSPGTYSISATIADEAAPFFGSAAVEVGGNDLSGVDITIRPSPRILGQIRIEGGGSGADLSKLLFVNAGGGCRFSGKTANPAKDGLFEVSLNPGNYRVLDPLDKFSIKSMQLDSKVTINGNLVIEPSSGPRQLVIILYPKVRP